MTFNRYLRLTLVMLLPLVIGGYVWSIFAVPKQDINIYCDQISDGVNFCRTLNDNGEKFDTVTDNPRSLFSITDNNTKSRSHFYSVRATARFMGDVKIDAARNLMGFPGQYPHGEELVGNLKNSSAILMLSGATLSRAIDGIQHLSCSEINVTSFKYDKEQYEIYCISNEWTAMFNVDPSSDVRQKMTMLNKVISTEIDRHETFYVAFKSFFTLLPLAVYFILSALIWLVFRATAFVRAG